MTKQFFAFKKKKNFASEKNLWKLKNMIFFFGIRRHKQGILNVRFLQGLTLMENGIVPNIYASIPKQDVGRERKINYVIIYMVFNSIIF